MAFKMNKGKVSHGVGTGSESTNKYVGGGTPEWSQSDDGTDVKTTTRKNLFGRKRVVKKYYDSETGEMMGKEVDVARGKGDPRANKKKIKQVNPGLTQSGGVGKIRLKQNPWDSDSPSEAVDAKVNREEYAAELKDKNVMTDPKTGKPIIPKYSKAFSEMKVGSDGKRKNPRNKSTYSDDAAGQDAFEKEAELWWDEQANITGKENKKLEKQDQPYSKEYSSSSTFKKKKKTSYKMKRYKK